MIGGLSHEEMELAVACAEDELSLVQGDLERAHAERDSERAAGEKLATTVSHVLVKHLSGCSLAQVQIAVMKLEAAVLEFASNGS